MLRTLAWWRTSSWPTRRVSRAGRSSATTAGRRPTTRSRSSCVACLGAAVQASYVKGVRNTWAWNTLRGDWLGRQHARPQAIKLNGGGAAVGRGRRYGTNASAWVDALIGGWEVDGVGRFQSGQKFNIGGFQLVGAEQGRRPGHVQVPSPCGRERRGAHLHVPRGSDQQLDHCLQPDVGDHDDRVHRVRCRRASTSPVAATSPAPPTSPVTAASPKWT